MKFPGNSYCTLTVSKTDFNQKTRKRLYFPLKIENSTSFRLLILVAGRNKELLRRQGCLHDVMTQAESKREMNSATGQKKKKEFRAFLQNKILVLRAFKELHRRENRMGSSHT